MSFQEPSHYAEDDMVLVAGSDYVRMASIGGGVLSIKLPTSSDSTPVVESIVGGGQLAVNGGTYVDAQRLGALYMRESGDGTTVTNSNYVMMYNPNGNPLKEITYSDDIPNHLNIIDASLNSSTIAIGSGSNATGTNSVAIGNNASTITYDNSVALGNGATAGADNAIILGDGTQNVGIGTSSPKSALQVNNDSGVTISPESASGVRTAVLRLGKPYEANHDAYCAKITSTNNHSANHASDLRFYTSTGNNANANERMCILSNGYVGIGDTTPDAKLHVRGNGPQLILEGESNEDSMVRLSAGPYYQNRFHEIRAQHYALANNGYRNYLRFKVNNGGQNNPSDTMSLNGDGNLTITGSYQSSDDRIKKNEVYITNAIESLLKLKPQLYDKYLVNDSSSNMLELSENFVKESGLIVQELYYDAPELRHLVMPADDAYDLSNNISSHDPQVDPDYSMWGSTPSSLNYCGLIAYLIKGMQEQQEIIEAEKAKTATLETKVSSLESQLSDILSRLSTLENP